MQGGNLLAVTLQTKLTPWNCYGMYPFWFSHCKLLVQTWSNNCANVIAIFASTCRLMNIIVSLSCVWSCWGFLRRINLSTDGRGFHQVFMLVVAKSMLIVGTEMPTLGVSRKDYHSCHSPNWIPLCCKYLKAECGGVIAAAVLLI